MDGGKCPLPVFKRVVTTRGGTTKTVEGPIARDTTVTQHACYYERCEWDGMPGLFQPLPSSAHLQCSSADKGKPNSSTLPWLPLPTSGLGVVGLGVVGKASRCCSTTSCMYRCITGSGTSSRTTASGLGEGEVSSSALSSPPSSANSSRQAASCSSRLCCLSCSR